MSFRIPVIWPYGFVGCLGFKARAVRALLLPLLVLGVWCAPVEAGQVELSLSASVSGSAQGASAPRMRALLIIDGTLSMINNSIGGERRWDVLLRDVEADVKALAASGMAVDVTVVKFGSTPSDPDRAGDSHTVTISPGASDAVTSAVDSIREFLGSPDAGSTAANGSILNAARSIERSSRAYQRSQLLIYTDGTDNVQPEILGSACSAVKAMIQGGSGTNAWVRSYGPDAAKLKAELAGAGVVALAAPLVVKPSLVSIGLSPEVVAIEKLSAPRSETVVVTPRGVPPDVLKGLEVWAEDSRGSRLAQARAENGSWSLVLPLPAAEAGLDIRIVARCAGVADASAGLRAPALRVPPNPSGWGLPRAQGCDGWGGVVRVGEAFPLSVRIPEDVRVEWRDEAGGWGGQGASVTHPGFDAPGEHRIIVSVRTADGEISERIVMRAFDPSLRIKGPSSVNARGAAKYEIDDSSPAIKSGAREEAVRWYVGGKEVSKGESLTTSFPSRGLGAVMAIVDFTICGQAVTARSAFETQVQAVPAVSLRQAELVSGVDSNRIPLQIMVPSRVSEVVVTFNGGHEEHLRPSQSSGDSAMVQLAVPQAVAVPGKLVVRAVPVVIGDDGKAERLDSGADELAYVIRAPSPRVRIASPVVNSDLVAGVPVKGTLVIEGTKADLDAVGSVRVRIGSRKPFDLPPGAPEFNFTPAYSDGGEVTVAVELLGRSGAALPEGQSRQSYKIGKPTMSLASTRELPIHLDSDKPVDVTVRVEGNAGASWKEGIDGDIKWTIAPASGGAAQASVLSSSDDRAVLRVTGPGAFRVVAEFRFMGESKRLSLEVPVVVDKLKPDFAVTELGGSAQIGTVIGERTLHVEDSTTGPIRARRFEMRRDGGDWKEINPDSFAFGSAKHAGERVEIRGIFTALDGTVDDTMVREFTASPDHNWAVVAVCIIAALGISAIAWWLCQNNDFLGAEYMWSADVLGHDEASSGSIRWMGGGATCSIVSKQARIPLPSMYRTEFDWVAPLVESDSRLLLGEGENRIIGPSGLAGAVSVSSGIGEAQVRRTTLQPTDGADPLYLTLRPSRSARFFGWLSTTAVLVAVWAPLAFLFIRGYI